MKINPISPYRAAFKTQIIEYKKKPFHPTTSQSMQKAKSNCGGQRIQEINLSAASKLFIGFE
jgi:hypothetical protein